MHGTLRVEIIQSKKCNIVKYMLRQIKKFQNYFIRFTPQTS